MRCGEVHGFGVQALPKIMNLLNFGVHERGSRPRQTGRPI
jgi:hypothetical protein